MIVLYDSVMVALAVVVVLKLASILHGIYFLLRKGGEAIKRARALHRERKTIVWSDIEASVGHERLFNAQAEWLKSDAGRAGRVASELLWRTYLVVPLLSVATLCAAEWSLCSGFAIVTCGFTAAGTAFALAISSVVRRFVLGSYDTVHWDLELPRSMREWAIQKEAGSNRSVYFLLVTMLTVLGFAALYCAINELQPTAFHLTTTIRPSAYAWVYFSLVTLSTLGLGDVYPATLWGQVAVSLEVLCGPVFLAWLIAMYLSASSPVPADQPREADS